jgi:hypothetical protein
MMYQKFHVPAHKKSGYNRLIGQEVPQDCWSGSNLATVERTVDKKRVTSRPEVSRYYKQVVNGPQTPKLNQPVLEVIHKLQFWFNNDVRLAIPSVSIPYGQRYISVDIAPFDVMAFEEPNLFIEETETTVQRCTVVATTNITRVGDGVQFAGNFNTSGNTTVKYYPYFSRGTLMTTILDFDMYINNIFVNPEVHDIYIRRIGFTLIRVHLSATISTNETGDGERLLTQLKWPIEYIFLGIRPRWNIDTLNTKQWRDWHRLTKVNTGRYDNQGTKVFVTSNNANTVGSLVHQSNYSTQPVIRDEYVSN